MKSPKGEDYVLKLIGKMGLHQVATIIVGRYDNDDVGNNDPDPEEGQ